jgi:hypothetical protein
VSRSAGPTSSSPPGPDDPTASRPGPSWPRPAGRSSARARAARGARAGLVLLGLVAGAPGPATAQSGGSNAECRANPHLARAKELYEDLNFEDAALTLQRALEFSNNCRWDLAEIYRLKAYVDAVNGERERCHRDFEIFLALNNEWQMPQDTPPKIRGCYEDARAVAASRRELGLAHEVPAEVPPNAPVALKIKVADPLRLVDQVRVFFRRDGVKVFTVVSQRADDVVSIVVPSLSLAPDPEGYRVEYIVRAVDRWDGVLVEEGSSKKPLSFLVLPGTAGGESVVTRWWFWALVGGAVAAGIGTALMVSNANRDSLGLRVEDGGVTGAAP